MCGSQPRRSRRLGTRRESVVGAGCTVLPVAREASGGAEIPGDTWRGFLLNILRKLLLGFREASGGQKPSGDSRSWVSAKYRKKGVSWHSASASGGAEIPGDARRGISAKYREKVFLGFRSQRSEGRNPRSKAAISARPFSSTGRRGRRGGPPAYPRRSCACLSPAMP